VAVSDALFYDFTYLTTLPRSVTTSTNSKPLYTILRSIDAPFGTRPECVVPDEIVTFDRPFTCDVSHSLCIRLKHVVVSNSVFNVTTEMFNRSMAFVSTTVLPRVLVTSTTTIREGYYITQTALIDAFNADFSAQNLTLFLQTQYDSRGRMVNLFQSIAVDTFPIFALGDFSLESVLSYISSRQPEIVTAQGTGFLFVHNPPQPNYNSFNDFSYYSQDSSIDTLARKLGIFGSDSFKGLFYLIDTPHIENGVVNVTKRHYLLAAKPASCVEGDMFGSVKSMSVNCESVANKINTSIAVVPVTSVSPTAQVNSADYGTHMLDLLSGSLSELKLSFSDLRKRPLKMVSPSIVTSLEFTAVRI
jgi:hypothetical protein